MGSNPIGVVVFLSDTKLLVVQLETGIMFAIGEPEMPPLLLHFGIIDQATSICGKVKVPGSPARFSKSSVKTKNFAPALGEHTANILADIGGYSQEEIARFKEAGVV